MKKIIAKSAGCLIGGAIGDALGAPVEFMNKHMIRNRYGEGGIRSLKLENGKARFTDDTQMTLFTAEGLLRMHTYRRMKQAEPSWEILLRAYHRWMRTQGIGRYFPREGSIYRDLPQEEIDRVLESGFLVHVPELNRSRAPGISCVSALGTGSRYTFNTPPNDSKGCGTIMRAAPAGIFHRDEPRAAFTAGCELSVLSHGHPTGYIAAGAFAMIIAHIFQGLPLLSASKATLEYLEKINGPKGELEFIRQGDCEETIAAIWQAIDAFHQQDSYPSDIDRLGAGWIAEEALSISLFAALVHQNDFQEAIVMAVNHSGDSDSTGSICGNIVGAVLGIEGIPENYRQQIELSPLIEEVAGDLVENEVDEAFAAKYPGW